MMQKIQIGFSQRIQLEWLERTANLVLAGSSKKEIEEILQEHLEDQLSIGGTAKRGNREKAITILIKVWVDVRKGLGPFRDDGLKLLQRLPIEEHLAVHWGMSMAAYPFFGIVADTTGKLLRLQDNVTASQVQRRLRELFGERETVYRAARRILRVFIDWEVVSESSKKGVYVSGHSMNITNKELIAWLIEASLLANRKASGSVKTIAQSPTLFPFKIPVPKAADLGRSKRLEIFHHSLDDEVVSLQRQEGLK